MFAWLRHVIPEENFQAWEQDRRCLCGCGEQTALMISRRKGAANFWLRGHDGKFIAKHGLKKPQRPPQYHSPTWRRNNKLANERNFITTEGLRWVLQEWLDTNGKTIQDLAREAGFNDSWLYGIRTGSQKRVKKSHAVALLEALGERPHPDLLKEVRAVRRAA